MSASEERKAHINSTNNSVPRHSFHRAEMRARSMVLLLPRSERDVVVLEIAAAGRLARRCTPARGLVAHAAVAAARAAAAAAQHLHLVHHDLGDVVLLAVLLVVAGAQAALDVDLLALAHVLADDLRQAVIEGELVPFGTFLLLAGGLVLPGLVGGRRKVDHRTAGGHVLDLRVPAHRRHQDHLVYAACHSCTPGGTSCGPDLAEKSPILLTRPGRSHALGLARGWKS